jgi:prophage antirepressor-like protein
MDLIKSFILDQTTLPVEIVLADGEELINASDLAKVLGIEDVATVVAEYDERDKKTDNLLTETGAYRLVLSSSEPIAAKFQEWVFNQIMSITKKGETPHFTESQQPEVRAENADNRRYTQARGSKVQRYSPDGTQLLETYVGLLRLKSNTCMKPCFCTG